MQKASLTKRQTAQFIDGLVANMKGRSNEEFKSVDVKQSIVTAVANQNAFDLESINGDFGTVKSYTFDSGVKLLGNVGVELKGFAAEHGSVDVESFDTLNSQNLDTIKLAAINIAGNNLKVDEDGIVALFSRESVSGNTTGVRFDSTNPLVTYGATSKNGIAIGGNRVSLIPNLDNKAIFASGRQAFKPVLRSSGDYITSASLVATVNSPIDYNGESVLTSPLKVNVQTNLRTVCSTSQYLADHTDGLNPNVTLAEDGSIRHVYIKMEGLDSSSDPLTNIFKVSVKGQKNTRFATVGQGNGKDVSLTYKGTARIKANEIVSKGTLVYTSKASEYLLDPTSTDEIVVEYTLSSSINTDTMKLTSSATKISLVEMYQAGDLLDSLESDYVDMVALLDAANVEGMDLDLFLSNTNNANNGLVIDVEESAFELAAVIKTPITIRKSVLGDVPADKIAGYLAAAKVASNSVKAAELLSMVDDFIEGNKDKLDADGFIKDVELDGVGSNYIKPMIIIDTIDAKNRSSRRSGETKEDISKYIYDTITTRALEVFTKSNLDKAIDVLASGEKVTLVLTTGLNVASYIKDAIDAIKGEGLKFDVEVHSSYQLSSRVLGTFKIGGKVYECSPLILVEGPDFIYKGLETTAGSNGNQDVTKLVPRRGSLVNAPVLFDYTVSGIVEALNK